MGWTDNPDVDSAMSSAEDNPFPAPKQQPVGKISVNLPTDDRLCRKMDRLSLTLVNKDIQQEALRTAVYRRTSVVKLAKSQAKWYGLHPNQDRPIRSVSFWHCDSAKLNSLCSRIARSSRLTSPAPTSCTRSIPSEL